MAIEGVSIGPDQSWLDVDPDINWYRLDGSDYNSLIAGYSISRGRQDELSRTGVGTARIFSNDRDGILDTTGSATGFSDSLTPMTQVGIALFNPVTETWTTIFRGFIDEIDTEMDRSELMNRTELACVDMFDPLGRIEIAPGGAFGHEPDYGSEGDVFYDDQVGDPLHNATPQDRIEGALDEAGLTGFHYQINTGNVHLQETVYAPGTSILTVCQDAADAEFPGLGNLFVSKDGIVRFTGRQVRFRPDVVEYDVDVWLAGDAAEAGDYAQVRGVGFRRAGDALINAALATPQELDEAVYAAHIADQLVTDTASIADWGVRTWSAENLLTKEGVATGNDKWEETKLFASYYVANYAGPRERITNLVFRSLRPDDPRAARTWALICGVEINDIIRLDITNKHGLFSVGTGGGFFSEDFYVEGITYDVRPLNPQDEWQDVTLTLDVTPRAFYNTNPFDSDPDPS